jgi:hypothetical protein
MTDAPIDKETFTQLCKELHRLANSKIPLDKFIDGTLELVEAGLLKIYEGDDGVLCVDVILPMPADHGETIQ